MKRLRFSKQNKDKDKYKTTNDNAVKISLSLIAASGLSKIQSEENLELKARHKRCCNIIENDLRNQRITNEKDALDKFNAYLKKL